LAQAAAACDDMVLSDDIAVGGCTECTDVKRALMKKVAQLTKVVVHLNARNDEAEARYDKLRKGFEDEIRTTVGNAASKIGIQRNQLEQLIDPTQLGIEAGHCASPWVCKRELICGQLELVKRKASEKQGELIEHGSSRLTAAAIELHMLTEGIRKSLAAYREVVGRGREELDQRDAELRERRAQELRGVVTEHQRRLDDLRSAHSREIEHLRGSTEQALLHVRRMHDSELGTLRMQWLQKRRERMHRLEQDFGEQRRTLEQLTAHAGFEFEQLRRDATESEGSCGGMEQQVEAMRVTLEEMRRRVEAAAADAKRVQEEAAEREAEVAALQSELAVLQVRQRAATAASNVQTTGQPRTSVAAVKAVAVASFIGGRAAGAELAQELRTTIAGTKQLEQELEDSDMTLAELDDALTEKDKQVEILEVEVEEERLRNHQLQVRIREKEATRKLI